MVPHNSKQQIWVFGDLRDRHLFGLSLNVLAKASKLAQDLNGELSLVIFQGGENTVSSDFYGSGGLSVETAVDSAVEHGANYVLCFTNDLFNSWQANIFAAGLANAIDLYQPVVCLFALTDLGRELAARTAAIGKLGLIADCMDLTIENDVVVGCCPAWGGSIMTRICFTNPAKTGLATVQPHGQWDQPLRGEPGTILNQTLVLDYMSNRLRLIKREPEATCHRRLEEADVVVVGGMGLASSKGFESLRALGAALGGEIAATRPPVLNGWVTEDRMIGQTGKNVKPKLLISIGTSGAIQYTAGIVESGFILAINSDPSAPIFQIADLGIVADAPAFLPLLIERVNKEMMLRLVDHICHDFGNTQQKISDGFGKKIQKLRLARRWSEEKLAEAVGRTKEFICEVENDKILPPANFLLQLTSIFKISPDAFFNQKTKKNVYQERSSSYLLRIQNNFYEPLTNGADTDHLRAFILTIPPYSHHKPVAYKHDGEEFVWVKSGELEVMLGNKNHTLKEGESVHFNSNTPHKLKNLSSLPTQCLVVLYSV